MDLFHIFFRNDPVAGGFVELYRHPNRKLGVAFDRQIVNFRKRAFHLSMTDNGGLHVAAGLSGGWGWGGFEQHYIPTPERIGVKGFFLLQGNLN